MDSTTFGERMLQFYLDLTIPHDLPTGVETMHPYKDQDATLYTRLFLQKYYSDNKKRILVFGINPGRFGAGITGITFTDPVALSQQCGIPNSLQQKKELSSEFVYSFINSWGGTEEFFKDFFLTAISPLGFVKGGKNYNYYDDRLLLEKTTPYIVESIQAQIENGGRTDVAVLLGTGKNQQFVTQLNEKHKFFQKVLAVEHPRFIMQYRRKQLTHFLQKYHETFTAAIHS